MQIYDIAIIGGGINGSGIAAQAAARGLSVLLCEQNDLTAGTSSASSKLIHGGLRYLEHGHLNLVRKSLQERDILLQKAPHLIQPLTFVLPHHANMRPVWLLRLGLWLYDHLHTHRMAKATHVHLQRSPWGAGLASSYQHGFSYSDCWVDDARLVIANALSAVRHGATILTRQTLLNATHEQGRWQLQLTSGTYYAHSIVNASGPWAERTAKLISPSPKIKLSLVKGSHIVVKRLFPGEHAYILQTADKRIVFILPYQQHFHLIGTTEVNYEGDLQHLRASKAEIDYLCQIASDYLATPISPQQVLHDFAGVRPLLATDATNTSRFSRDYQLQLQAKPLLLTVLGGKLTTYRILAEQTINKLAPFFPHISANPSPYSCVPGGELGKSFNDFQQEFCNTYAWLTPTTAHRLARSYGSCAYQLLGDATRNSDLGQDFGYGLTEREVTYLRQHEWAITADDILWRRTKLGLLFTAEQRAALDDWLSCN